MTCARCAGAFLVAIKMRVGGEDLVFQRCARCETNHWAADSGEISLEEVLEMARVSR